MGVARCPDASLCITDNGFDAAPIRLKVNEVRFNGPTSEGWLVAEVQEALVYLHIVLPFDVGSFEFVHGFGFRG